MILLACLAALTSAPEPVPAPVLARSVARGDLLSAADFTSDARLPAEAKQAIAPGAAAGMEVTRALPAGAIVRRFDVTEPRLVKRGEPVTIRVREGALTISATGRALSDGRKGDTVRVVTTGQSRTLDAAVEGTGAVRIAAN